MPARPGLDRAAVVEAAAALADAAHGKDVTLGDLATHLGVRTPSLYNHVAGQDGLRRELALFGLRELGRRIERAAIGKAGDDAVLAIAHAYRRFALERPGLYVASLRAPDREDRELQAASEELLAVLRLVLAPYGFRGDAAIHVMRGLRSVAHGFVSLELLGGFGIPLALDESYERLVRMFIDGMNRRASDALHPDCSDVSM